jgi:transketolase
MHNHSSNEPIDMDELDAIARTIRGKLVEMSHAAGTPHLGSALSCVDILVALYWSALRIDPAQPDAPERDRCILSKGHAATALYATLAYRGFFSPDLLDTFNQDGTALAEHPSLGCAPGIEASTGSLGHGLPLGLGMALAARIQQQAYRVFVVMSDGECNEGSVWEAAMMTAAHQVDTVMAFVDYNKWQATGRSNEVLALSPLRQKWEAFGWNTHEVDGHDMAALVQVLRTVPDSGGKPVVVIANTVKGKGISFMEDDNNWHYRIPTAEEVAQARMELGLV